MLASSKSMESKLLGDVLKFGSKKKSRMVLLERDIAYPARQNLIIDRSVLDEINLRMECKS